MRCGRRCARRTPTWRSSPRRSRSPSPRPTRSATTRSSSSGRSSARRCRGSGSRPRCPRRRPRSPSSPCRPRGARRSCCTSATSRSTPTPSARPPGGCWRGSPGARRSASRAAPCRPGGAARSTTCAPRSASRCATAASSSSAATAPRRGGRAGSSSCAMFPAPWRPYARMLLMYLQACVAARARVEAFVFGTRLTRVTRELAGRDPDRALGRAAEAVSDWSGGTRIGEALAELNRVHGRRIGRGALVVILSDGWDRGDPEQLERGDGPPASAARTASCGSTRSPPTPATSRSRAACRRRSRTSTTSSRATRSRPWKHSPS